MTMLKGSPYNPKLVIFAKKMRRHPTLAEKKLWLEYLRGHKLRFLRQRPIDNFIVDFYCASCKLVIEIDGDSHFSEDAQVYDQHRTSILEGYGLRVIRFTNDEVLHSFDAVCEGIEQVLIPPNPPFQGGLF
jgi:very-short-patch-repair endonuclease